MTGQRIVNGSLLAVFVVVATAAGWSAVRAALHGRAAAVLVSVLTTLGTLVLAYAFADALRRRRAAQERFMMAAIVLLAVGVCVQIFWM